MSNNDEAVVPTSEGESLKKCESTQASLWHPSGPPGRKPRRVGARQLGRVSELEAVG